MNLHSGLLEAIPVGQVAGQPVHVADDDHVDLVPFDRPDQVHEVVAADLFERRVPVVLEPRHHCPAAPPRMPVGAGQLGRHRLGRVVGLAQPRVTAARSTCSASSWGVTSMPPKVVQNVGHGMWTLSTHNIFLLWFRAIDEGAGTPLATRDPAAGLSQG